jgi:hypothetical protein
MTAAGDCSPPGSANFVSTVPLLSVPVSVAKLLILLGPSVEYRGAVWMSESPARYAASKALTKGHFRRALSVARAALRPPRSYILPVSEIDSDYSYPVPIER